MSVRRRARRGEKRSANAVRLASPDCPSGKRAYVTRSEAHRVAVWIQKQMGGERMSPYLCKDGCAYWHIGHLPRAVKRGEVTRDEYRKDAAA